MALITCPECGREISDKAAACPNCGAPIEKTEIPMPTMGEGFESAYKPPVNSFSQPYVDYGAAANGNKKEKASGLSIAAFVLSVLGITAIIGMILAVVDLVKNPERKKGFSIAALCVGVVWFFIIMSSAYSTRNGKGSKLPEAKELAPFYYGTWETTKIEVDGVTYDKSELKWAGKDDVVAFMDVCVLVLREDGTYQYGDEVEDWYATEEGVVCDGELERYVDGYIIVKTRDYKMYMEKTSDSQAFRDTFAVDELRGRIKNGNNSNMESSSAESNSSSSSQTIRPEFKEAMDSYEAFFDEYVSFMKRYSSSNDIMSMMNDYTNYMSKYMDTMDKMSKLENEAMNDAELQYYIEVTARIEKKLLEVSMSP